ncbi:uncharacterized protein LOC120350499 [Nilaparvata lugens]|uniref:uncharacterized protein LOC120350499 n=1 Tax=Nilaparvata lugens TaxID=108931 RepID=UPI00193E11C4|nr:uncharacterized protein LOC120350499 [Nilaparvata lugens]
MGDTGGWWSRLLFNVVGNVLGLLVVCAQWFELSLYLMDVILSLVGDVVRLLSAFCRVQCDLSLDILGRRTFISGMEAGVWLMVIRWFFIWATVRDMGVPDSGATLTECSSDASSSSSWAVNGSSTKMQLSSTCVNNKSSSICGSKSADAVPDADGRERSGGVFGVRQT